MPASRYVFIAAIATIVAIAIAIFARALDGSAGAPQYATLLPEPVPLPEFSLVDQHNAPFTRDSLRGQTSLMFFGFTHCPDICPATLQQLAAARKQLAEASPGTGALPEIILISVDPERDTPGKLDQYVTYFGDGVAAATGSMEAIRELTSPLGIYFEKQPNAEVEAQGNYSVSHSTAVLVIDENASLKALFSAPHKTESFVHDLPRLMASR
ncbi:MAG: SCO family protein [Woeseia sp.]